MIETARRLNRKSGLRIILLLLFVALIGFAIYYFNQYNSIKNSPDSLAKQEKIVLVRKVGKLMELPGEDPSIATITDINKLKDQIFFTNSKNGDKLLIFAKAEEAILYRPSTNKIIAVAPINLGNTESSSPK